MRKPVEPLGRGQLQRKRQPVVELGQPVMVIREKLQRPQWRLSSRKHSHWRPQWRLPQHDDLNTAVAAEGQGRRHWVVVCVEVVQRVQIVSHFARRSSHTTIALRVP